MNQAVTAYIDKITQGWQVPICTRIRELIHQAVPDVEERIQYGKPHFLQGGKYAFVLAPAKGWVSFTIFNATTLEAPAGYFEQGPPERKTIKLRAGQEVDYAFLSTLIQQAVGANLA
ncbi:MAG TPA: DUF1801 domain-containing protein [Thermomicrobiales bacterium]|jgi:hypothetical protein